MKTSEIRQKFLQYFQSQGHTAVPSSSLVPGNDPTLLFTNSGMVQFKDVFTGKDSRPYKRATSSQRSVRAGGKHNDLENVGYTARHHTFFEMLGNFSFGDYFKRDAIKFAWAMLTEVYALPKEKLWVTVYQEDDEAYGIWQNEIGVPAERIVRIGDNKGARYASDNFWQMADTGPCGPCTEIFYDHGPEIWGGPPGSAQEDGDRYIEIWNLVFMQFERDAAGTLTPLPKPCVDTGMGLERLAAVLQHVHSNYEIDLFVALIAAASRETGCQDLSHNSLKVIADHIRACSFLIVDGVIPSNEGRGYVLRRIIRRALRHGYKLGQTKPFFYLLVKDLVTEMGQAYPELAKTAARVEQVLRQEEERFGETLEHGMKILDVALAALPAVKPGSAAAPMLDGNTVFTLYDTYGFPFDLTADICRERNVEVDQAGFDTAMDRQRDQARAAGKFKMAEGLVYQGALTNFEGYEHLQTWFPSPQYQLSIVHGRLKSADKEFEMQRFIKKQTQIMVATTVIEVGVNVPNASVMIIESAERFGLSQLHQLRGRVGRGADQSYCLLMTGFKLSREANIRLETMVRTNDGFEIAEVDLQLRGPGDLQGTQQSGDLDLNIADISKDNQLLAYCRQFASAILDTDPDLELPEHALLKQQLLNMEKRKMDWGRIS